MLIMCWAGAKDWALRGPLGVAAKLTVDEHNGTFAKWKPYSRSAVPPKIAKSVDRVPERGAPLKKRSLRAPPRKDGELSPWSNRLGEEQRMYDESRHKLRSLRHDRWETRVTKPLRGSIQICLRSVTKRARAA
jgi:hypothetical protein